MRERHRVRNRRIERAETGLVQSKQETQQAVHRLRHKKTDTDRRQYHTERQTKIDKDKSDKEWFWVEIGTQIAHL